MASHTFRIPPDIFDRMKLAATKRGITVTDLILDPWRKEGDELEYVPSPDPKDHGPTHTTAVLAPRQSRTVVVSPKRRTAIEPETLGHHGPKARDKSPKPSPTLQPKSWDGSPIERKTASPKKR